jgi:hypothetical protein
MIALLTGFALAADPDPDPAQEPAEAEVSDTVALRREVEALRAELQELRRSSTTEATPGELAADAGGRAGVGREVRVELGDDVPEAVSIGDDVRVAGRVRGDAVSLGGDVIVASTGQVEGDAVALGGRVVVEVGGSVAGDRVTLDFPIAAFAGLGAGETTPEGVEAPPPPVDEPPRAAGSVLFAAHDLFHDVKRKVVWMLSFAGAGVLVVGLFPARVTRVARDLEDRPLRAAVVGTLASSFLALFAVLFTLLTLGLGLPVGALLLAILGVAWILGFVALCQAVGDRLPIEAKAGSAWPGGRWIAFLVGVLLLTFAGSLPWVGWMVLGAASVLGIGSTFATRFGGS